MTEFELIEQVFAPLGRARPDVALGIGDDAALLRPPAGELLVACVDTLVAGVHFPPEMRAVDIGYRAAAVNLSDLAAMGAQPRWATLGLTLPAVRPVWLRQFAQGLRMALAPHEVALVGGDTTRGPLTISLQLLGSVPDGLALTRGGSRVGDAVFVSGTLGDSAAGLSLFGTAALARSPAAWLTGRFRRPTPRLALGRALRGHASACIDVSDGLLADAGHLAERSAVQLRLWADALPRSTALLGLFDPDTALRWAATGGDDYELCFTVPPTSVAVIEGLQSRLSCRLTQIGEVRAGAGVVLCGPDGSQCHWPNSGYRHF